MSETSRRRKLQHEFNQANNITPKTIFKKIKRGLMEVYDPTLALESGFEFEALAKKYDKKPSLLTKEIESLKKKMKKLSANLDFEEAAKIRDEIKRLQILELEIKEPD